MRQRRQFENGGAGFVGPRRELIDLFIGALGPAAPLILFGGNRRDPVGARLGLALQAIMGGTRFGIGGALTIHGVAQFVQFSLQRVEHRQAGGLGTGRLELTASFVQ